MKRSLPGSELSTASDVRQIRVAGLVALLLYVFAAASGFIGRLDFGLNESLAAAASRKPSGSIVVVTVDAQTIRRFGGGLPIRRTALLRALEELAKAEVARVLIDFALNIEGDPADDAALEAILARFGKARIGITGSILQSSGEGEPEISVPIERFLRHASVLEMPYRVHADGSVWRADAVKPMAPLAGSGLVFLASGRLTGHDAFSIDHSIDYRQIDHIPLVGLIDGEIDLARLRDKSIIIGLGISLPGFGFRGPLNRPISRATLAAIASETVVLGRKATPPSTLSLFLFGAVLATLLAFLLAKLRALQSTLLSLSVTLCVVLGMDILARTGWSYLPVGYIIAAFAIAQIATFASRNAWVGKAAGSFLGLFGRSDLVEQAARRASDLEKLALRDPLTGLANRHALDLLRAKFGSAAKPGAAAAFIVDLDRFKALNDRYGHEAGDRMLAAVADKMRMVLPPDTFCARLGGDEFIAVLQGTDLVPHQLLLVGRRLCDAIQTPVVGGDATLEVGASIGIALGQLPGDLTDLMQNADRAMYEAKRSGSGVRLWQAESEDLLKSA